MVPYQTLLLALLSISTLGLQACSKSECKAVTEEGPSIYAAVGSASLDEAVPRLERLRDALAQTDEPSFRLLLTRAEQLEEAVEAAMAPDGDASLEEREASATRVTQSLTTFSSALQDAQSACQ